MQFERGGLGLVGFRLGDVALRCHLVEHGVAARGGVLRVDERVVGRRRLWQTGDERGLRQRQSPHRRVEVRERCGLHADRVLAVEDPVQVLRENLILRVLLLDLGGEVRLLDLLREAARRVWVVQVLGQLHGDGAAALPPAARRVVDGCADKAQVVDAVVLVEALVLDGHRGVAQRLGDACIRDLGAIGHARDDPERLAVAVEDLRVLSQRHGGELVKARQPVGGRLIRHGARNGQQRHPDGEGERQHATEAHTPMALTVLAPAAHAVDGNHRPPAAASGRMSQTTRPVR